MLDRFRSLPIARSTPLVGAVMAEVVRYVISVVVLPVSTMPGWLQAWVSVNPVTQLVTAVRSLLLGGPTAWPVTQSLLWCAGLVVVFAPLAVRAYRRKA